MIDLSQLITAEDKAKALVPATVTRRQGRLALIDLSKLLEVEAMIAAIEDPVERLRAQVEYEADTWELANPFLQATWASLSEPKPPLEDMFILASTK